MRVIAFDQSLKGCAASLLESTEPYKFRVKWSETCPTQSTGIYRLADLSEWIRGIFESESDIDTLCREMHTQRMYGAAAEIMKVGGIIDLLAHEYNFLEEGNYAMVSPGTWKKFCLGRGNMKKDTAYLLHMNKFLSTSEHLIEVEQVVDDNIADSICIGLTGAVTKGVVDKDSNLFIDDDAKRALVRASEKMFEYGTI